MASCERITELCVICNARPVDKIAALIFRSFQSSLKPMRIVVFLCFLAVLLTGCDPLALRDVSLQLPPPEAQESVTVSADRADVQEAFSIINSVMTSKGMIRVDTSPQTNTPGFVADFRSPENPTTLCGVFIKDNILHVRFGQSGRMFPSHDVRQICDILYAKLSSRYGAERVKVSGKNIN